MKRIIISISIVLLSTIFAKAAPAGDAIEIFYSYFHAISSGNCGRAIEIRRGYSIEACNEISEVIEPASVLKNWETAKGVILQFSVSFLRNEKAEYFSGFVLLSKANDTWTIENSSFASGGSLRDYVVGTLDKLFKSAAAAARQLPDYSQSDIDAADTPSNIGNMPIGNTDVNQPTPREQGDKIPKDDGKTANTGAQTGNAPSGIAIGEEVPVEMSSTADSASAELSPPEPSEQESVLIDKDKNAPETPHSRMPPSYTEGELAAAEKCQTPDVCLTQNVAVAARDRLREVGSGAAIVDGPETMSSDPASSPGVPRRIENTGGAWPGSHGSEFGSEAILNACFDGKMLAQRPGEKKLDKTNKLAFLAVPQRLQPTANNYNVEKRYRRSIRSVDTGGRKLIALGFDICEKNNDFTGYDGGIIDFLRANKVKATLYMSGKWMATHPERSMQLIADPLFEKGNHAWTHGNFRVLAADQIDDQIYYTEAQYELLREELLAMDCSTQLGSEEAARIPPRMMTFRFPYGTCNADALERVNGAGLPAVQWDTVTADPARGQTAAAISDVLVNAKPGAIVVMHANGRGWNTAKALRTAIPELKRRGFEFVTVAELLQMGEPVASDNCYERKPGDNKHYDRIFGTGTGD